MAIADAKILSNLGRMAGKGIGDDRSNCGFLVIEGSPGISLLDNGDGLFRHYRAGLEQLEGTQPHLCRTRMMRRQCISDRIRKHALPVEEHGGGEVGIHALMGGKADICFHDMPGVTKHGVVLFPKVIEESVLADKGKGYIMLAPGGVGKRVSLCVKTELGTDVGNETGIDTRAGKGKAEGERRAVLHVFRQIDIGARDRGVAMNLPEEV
ncbi:hypothetical protein HMPREF1981_03174 [Bacteroides pyogenes F0041]|uniref:Uncharacterized protein n=1 Tax=Bacteroides pyogenes F0041 TaxID=1321819 RepID=U2CA42_9BACE|nr:hypothetical protein HMPREF1981_03174 [Bacteroides pyogenes F0041]